MALDFTVEMVRQYTEAKYGGYEDCIDADDEVKTLHFLIYHRWWTPASLYKVLSNYSDKIKEAAHCPAACGAFRNKRTH